MSVTSNERIIILVDMDCFYVQVEQKCAPEFKGKPCAVVQYNAWKGGGIIAVNYEARDRGVTRNMRGDMAKTKCPDIHLFQVAEERGKANLNKYREAGAEVMKELCQFSDKVERASIDEAYLDVTDIVTKQMEKTIELKPNMLPNTFVVGWERAEDERVLDQRAEGMKQWLESSCTFNHIDKRLAIAGIIAEEMRASVFENTGYRCSAGIAHNKMLAKLICGLHKPNKQTLLPFSSLMHLYKTIPVHKVRSLGGKFGEEVKEKLSINLMSELAAITETELQRKFGEKNGKYLFDLARGVETDPVTSRQLSKSIGCGKNFPGKTALATKKDVSKWLGLLIQELEERLKKDHQTNQRTAQLLTISIRQYGDKNFASVSRSCPIHSYDSAKLMRDAMNVLEKLNIDSRKEIWSPAITNLTLSAAKFHDSAGPSTSSIDTYFTKGNFVNETWKMKNIESAKLELNDRHSCSSFDGYESDSLDKNLLTTFDAENDKPSCSLPVASKKGFFSLKLEENMKLSATEKTTKTKANSLFSNGEKKMHLSDNNSSEGFFASKIDDKLKNPDINEAGSSKVLGIQSFFGKNEESFVRTNLNTDVVENDECFNCDQCEKQIPLAEVEDHLDYHFALKVQKELRAESSSLLDRNTVNKSQSAKNNGKRKPRDSKSKNASKKLKGDGGHRTLEFYLKK